MLVLTRKTQEKIQIGNDITITILRIKGNVVRVGIEAPRDVRVLRAEIPVFDAEQLAQAVPAVVAEAVTAEMALGDESAEVAEVEAETQATARPAATGPSIGRRFVIQRQPDRFGRSQVSAVAAP